MDSQTKKFFVGKSRQGVEVSDQDVEALVTRLAEDLNLKTRVLSFVERSEEVERMFRSKELTENEYMSARTPDFLPEIKAHMSAIGMGDKTAVLALLMPDLVKRLQGRN